MIQKREGCCLVNLPTEGDAAEADLWISFHASYFPKGGPVASGKRNRNSVGARPVTFLNCLEK